MEPSPQQHSFSGACWAPRPALCCGEFPLVVDHGGARVGQLEYHDALTQKLRLPRHAFGSGRRLFHQGGILLRHLVHLRDGTAYGADPRGLIPAQGCDLPDERRDSTDTLDDVAHGLAGALDEFRATVDPPHAVGNETLDLL